MSARQVAVVALWGVAGVAGWVPGGWETAEVGILVSIAASLVVAVGLVALAMLWLCRAGVLGTRRAT